MQCLVPGSHRWTQQKLESHPEGLTHPDLNMWSVQTMIDLIDAGAVELANDDVSNIRVCPAADIFGKPSQDGDGAQNTAEQAAGPVVVPQLVAKAGSIVLMHPWTIHCGTTNLRSAPRLLGNGMVRITGSGLANGAWDRINKAPVSPL